MGTIKLSTLLGCTDQQTKRSVHYRLTPPTCDLVSNQYTNAAPLSIVAGTEYRMNFDLANLARSFNNGFNANTGITRMYDFVNHVSIFDEFNDTPTIVSLPNVYFKPSTASKGECLISCYVNETVPILHDQAIVGFQGTIYEKMGDLFSFYLGNEVGYQLKSKGVYFTFIFDHNGQAKDFALNQYLT